MDNWEEQRQKIIGLGKGSMRKSYYPQLKTRLKELEDFKKILDHSLDGILLIRLPQLIIHDFNAVVLELFDLDEHDLQNASIAQIFSREDLMSIEAFIRENSKRSLNEYRITVEKQHFNYTYELNLNKIDSNDSDPYIIAIIRDITTRVKRERELKEAKEAAEAANKAKSEFLAVMSHELRTPLNPIIGFTEILQHTITDEPEAEYLELVKDSALKQLELIDKILNYSRLEHGDIKPQLEWFSLRKTCELSLRAFEASFTNIDLQLSFTSNTPGWEQKLEVHSDEGIISQILENLIGNACKYTPQGRVVLNVSPEYIKNSKQYIKFEISDNGVGIEENKKEVLFEAFSQADNSYRRSYGGVGLGLAIVKKLVSILHGTIDFSSELDVGSTFSVTIPFQVSTSNPSQIDQMDELQFKQLSHRCSILVFEDTEENAVFIKVLLSRMGASCTIVESPTKGIKLAKENAYDLILMDLSMPQLDGFECTSIIKHSPGPNKNTPIIAVSANTDQYGKERCKKLGMTAYIEKPIDHTLLIEAIESALMEGNNLEAVSE